jgi:hypothetical protein
MLSFELKDTQYWKDHFDFHVYEQREGKIVGTGRTLKLRKQDTGDINQDSMDDFMDAIELKNSWVQVTKKRI